MVSKPVLRIRRIFSTQVGAINVPGTRTLVPVPVEPEEHGRVPVDPEHEPLRLGLGEAGHVAVEAGLSPGHPLHVKHHGSATTFKYR